MLLIFITTLAAVNSGQVHKQMNNELESKTKELVEKIQDGLSSFSLVIAGVFSKHLLAILSMLGSSSKEWNPINNYIIIDKLDELIKAMRVDLINTFMLEQSNIKSVGSVIGRVSSVPIMLPSIDSTSELSNVLDSYRAELIRNITDDIRNDIAKRVKRAIITGVRPDDLVSELADLNNGVLLKYNKRITTIVRTEYSTILNMAEYNEILKQGSIYPNLKKMWVHTGALGGSYQPRPSHMAASGQTVRFDEPFIVDGEKLMFPSDPNGSARNVINCGCVMIPIL